MFIFIVLVCYLVVYCMVVWLTGIYIQYLYSEFSVVLPFYGPARHFMM